MSVRTVQLQRALRRDRALASAVNDERTRAARARAFVLASWAMLSTQALILGAATAGVPITGAAAARLTMVVGVVTALVAFVAYDRE
jgi:hypothetical protein